VYNKLGRLNPGLLLFIAISALILDINLWVNGYTYIFLLYGIIQSSVCFLSLSYLSKALELKKNIIFLNNYEIYLVSIVLIYFPVIPFVISYLIIATVVLFIETFVMLKRKWEKK